MTQTFMNNIKQFTLFKLNTIISINQLKTTQEYCWKFFVLKQNFETSEFV